MARDRERQCEYYQWEGQCAKGHEGTFHDACQTCPQYRAKKGARPKRRNLRREKNLKWLNDPRNFE